jgi:transcriptional/translational regulatory protein YebC/TACO1
VDTESDPIEIYTEPGDLEGVRTALDAAGVNVDGAESAMLAKQTVSLEADQVRKAMRMVDLLEDLDDVQRVTTNVDIPEEVLAELAG